MSTSQALIAELTQESVSTRRVLERIPEDRLSWRPHAKSMSLGQLALHLALLPRGIAELVSTPRAEAPQVPLPEPSSVGEILEALDGSVREAAERLGAWSDEDLRAEWTMTIGGEPVLSLPRGQVVRTIMLNHAYHHRGQLTVYLRLLEVPLPPIYGPTADEEPS